VADPAVILAATPLFSQLDPTALRELAEGIEQVHVVSGDTLMREGEAGDCLYVVASGRLGVVVEGPAGEEMAVAEIGRGETVGEMALLTGAPRSATVRAVRDTILLRFSKASFDALLDRHPHTTMQLARLIVTRLEQSIHGRRDASAAPVTLAIAPAGTAAPVSLVARLVAEQLGPHGPTMHLTWARLESALGAASTDDATVMAWLDAQEADHQFVVYECDDAPTAWTRRCLRQADRIVLAARAEGDTALSEVEHQLQSRGIDRARARMELVIVHPAGTQMPSRGGAWRAARQVTAHHHVREGSAADAQRLGRLLLGKGVGVVLSGGGARGFAHLGVLRALDECGVPIDAIGAASMGAIIGGLYACGYSHEERMERARQGFAENPPDKDFTLPVVAVNHGGRGIALLRGMYGDARIEDLWTPYFCVSTNLTRAETRVSREGPLWKFVSASASPPGISPPIFDDGQLLADGGILDNLPVGVMRKTTGIGVTVASDVGAAPDTHRQLPAWDGVSGWSVLWQRLYGGRDAARVPSLIEILMLTSTISSVPAGLEARRLADLYLSPPSVGVKFAEWKGIDRAAEAGYQYAMERIHAWREKTDGGG
jgi:predicted acylesterase/phospholipase RssA/CRP-like cAMP-binding protein